MISMRIEEIVKPNKKGQVVIPKKMRDALSISENTSLQIVKQGHSIYMYPIHDSGEPREKLDDVAYMQILQKTQGAWSGDRKTRLNLATC